MKWNWGTGMAIVAMSFVIFILNLVYRCSHEQVDLVSERYYENEIHYQERINSQRNVIAAQGHISINRIAHQLELTVPAGFAGKRISGSIEFFRPDDARLDFSIPFNPNVDGSQRVQMADLKKGQWRMSVAWSFQGTSFYQEEKIWVN
jgi:hypothetical protein